MKHVHSELIKAWADGATIQALFAGVWKDATPPRWDENHQYHIKPELVPIYPEGFQYNGSYVNANESIVKDILKEFVTSGKLQQYVVRHGLNGLKSYD